MLDTPKILSLELRHQLFTSVFDDICCGIFVVEVLQEDPAKPCRFVGKIVNKPFCELLSTSEDALLEKELPEALSRTIPLRDMLLEAVASESRKFFKAHLSDVDLPCNILIYSPLPGFQIVIVKGAHGKSGKTASDNLLCRPDSIQEQAEEVLASLGELCTVIDENFVIQYQNGQAQKFRGSCIGQTCYEAYQERTSICDDCYAAKVFSNGEIHKGEMIRHNKDGERHLEVTATPLRDATGAVRAAILLSRDMSRHKMEEKSREHLIRELQASLARTKRLNGLLPICSHCKKIKDGNGVWQQLESYLRSRAEVEFSHGICQECSEKHHPQIFNKKK